MLSKGDLLAFRQCPRRLWLEHREADEASPTEAENTCSKIQQWVPFRTLSRQKADLEQRLEAAI